MTMGRGGAGFAAEPADDAPSRKPIKMRSPDAAAEMLALLESQCMLDAMPAAMAADLCRALQLVD